MAQGKFVHSCLKNTLEVTTLHLSEVLQTSKKNVLLKCSRVGVI